MLPHDTTRASISVSPVSRAPFLNQAPSRKKDQASGLLGGLLQPTRHKTVDFPATTQHSVRGNRVYMLIFCQRRWTRSRNRPSQRRDPNETAESLTKRVLCAPER